MRLWFLRLAPVLLLSACSCYIQLTATGSLPGPITAQFPKQLGIEAISVERQEGKGHWVRIWEAKGKAKLSSITYGILPKGMRQLTAPEALRRQHIYHTRIETPSTFFGPPCGGGVFFWITANGQVKTCTTTECEKQLFAGKIPD